MEIYILNSELERVGVVDVYSSLIWNLHYNRPGSWEIRCPLRYLSLLQPDRIVQNSEDQRHNGIVEYIEKVTDEDGSESLAVKGRTLEAILERRTALGENVYQSQQPSAILKNLIEKNVVRPADVKRKINNFEIVGLPDSDSGVVSYSCDNESLLSIAENLCQEAQLGFSLTADDENKRYLLSIYKGVNRTEESNIESNVEERSIDAQLVANWDFSSDLSSWTIADGKNGLTVSGSGSSGKLLTKRKLWEHWKDEITGEKFSIPLRSGYVFQNLSLRKDHIYYMAIRCNNPTDSVVGFGILKDKACTFQLQNEGFNVHSALYVPESSGSHTFALGYGDLSDEPKKENEYLTVDYGMLIDLTSSFGAGSEPDLSWCRENIYYRDGWKYKVETFQLIPNGNDPLVFSRERDSLLTVEYSKNTVNERTYLYIRGDGLDTAIASDDNADKDGTERKEVFIDLSGSLKRQMDGITIPSASYLAMLQREGRATLAKMAVKETIDGTLYPLNNKKYRKDFFLGDLVNCVDSRIGFASTLRITESQETWDTSGYTLSIVLGEEVPDLYETIRLVTKGAK